MSDHDELKAYLANRDVPCPKCGYNLRGSAESICPECGFTLDLNALQSRLKMPWYDTFLPFWFALVMIFLGAGMFLWYEFPTRLLPNRRGVVLASVLVSTLIPLALLIGTRTRLEFQSQESRSRIHAWVYASPITIFFGFWILLSVLSLMP